MLTDTEKKEVHLLESVTVTHVSLVDKPANRTPFLLVKRSKVLDGRKPTLDKLLDDERKAWDSAATNGESVDKVASPGKPKGKWVRMKNGSRFFVPERKLRDKVGANDMAQGVKLPKPKTNNR